MSLLDDLAAIAKRASCDEWCGVDNCAVFRIRAALADHEHLEKGARLLAITEDHPEWGRNDFMHQYLDDREAWLAAEAKRKDETNG